MTTMTIYIWLFVLETVLSVFGIIGLFLFGLIVIDLAVMFIQEKIREHRERRDENNE